MYSTDVTDAQWNNIKNYLAGKERKRKISLRSVWNALMYVVKTGCQWRMLPRDFPKWQLVYYYYRKWIDAELFDMILEKLRSKVRILARVKNPVLHSALWIVKACVGAIIVLLKAMMATKR